MSAPEHISEQLVKYFFTTEAVASRPTTWEVSLHTGLPSLGGNECTDGNYARQSAVFSAYDQGDYWEADNDAILTFPAGDVGADIDLTHFAVWDAGSGAMLGQGSLPSTVNLIEGRVLSFPAHFLKNRGV